MRIRCDRWRRKRLPEKEQHRTGNKDNGIEKTYGRVDASFGTARAKAVWISRGQRPCCPPFIHTLGPRDHDDHRFNNKERFIKTMPKKFQYLPEGFFWFIDTGWLMGDLGYLEKESLGYQ